MRTNSPTAAFILGLFIALGLIGAAFVSGKALLSFKDADRYVTVKGLAEREVDANLVIWPLSFAEAGNELAGLYEIMQKRQAAVTTFLTSRGIQPTNITANPPDITDFQARKYNPANQQRQYRYLARATLTVRSENVELVRQLMGTSSELIKQGIVLTGDQYQMRPEFLYTTLNSIKPDMIREATEGARKAAEQFARDSGSAVGKIRNARQGIFSIVDRDRNSPYRKIIRVVTTVDYMLTDI
ncbi:SIMPL domain-containing protein [Desulfogranum marinum]|jgi:hypothetical protein|uniref:SIMPL domain-containing protein n=1 Tax=Desulfogranum marinum TaxID=453220 RepID=UPI0029C6FEBC|nr:SIMPL domain-containing protein [Desulfogranum marinum]